MALSCKRVLITGINGFTGRYMAASLRDSGYDVFGSLPQHNVDLRDQLAIRRMLLEVRPHFVVHLAALAFVGHGDANSFYEVNLIGTRNLLEALAGLELLPTRVLLASSANVYGNAQEGILDEKCFVSPANDYAVSKLAMEQMASLWQNRLPLIITRPFNYTGLGQDQKFLIPKIVSHFRAKADVIQLGNLDVWRDFSDVRTIVDAYKALLESDVTGQTFNVCSGEAHSLRQVLAMCESITGHSIKVEVNPDFVRANEVKTLCGSASKLRQIIPGWRGRPLEETLSWMLGH